MKRTLTIALAIIMVLGICLPVSADGEVNLQTSKYCASAFYRDYASCFKEAEEVGMNSTLTRASLCTIMAHFDGITDETVPDYCTDVPEDAWYTIGVNWAVKYGFFSVSDLCLFKPELEVSREELSFVLRKYMDLNHVIVPKINAWFSFYDGGFFYSAYFQDCASALQMYGIIIEDENGCYSPQKTVTVGEFESIFLRVAYHFTGEAEPYPSFPRSTVAESAAVEDAWFDDACFIGHSQVVGMQKYFNLSEADYYAVVGYTANGILNHDMFELPQGGFGTLQDGLSNNSYGKVYIMLGINDCSDRETRVDDFLEPMKAILDMVKETQPNAKIYLISLAPVGRFTPSNYLYNPQNTLFYSQLIKTLSRQYKTEYLDLYRLMADQEGYFKTEFDAGDGIHIQPAQYDVIKDYLMTHT